MPYIKQEQRQEVLLTGARSPGELNYEISTAIALYKEKHGLNYQTINDIIGALEGAKLEFYRRVAAPYEDKKIAEHGDVY